MDAQEAREKAEEFIIARDTNQIAKIEKLIRGKSSIGKFNLNIYEKIEDQVFKWLTEDGYKIVKSIEDRNSDVTYKISWNEI